MLRLENVSKSIGSKTILKNISIHVEAGQIFGYLGPNGAGKTTTIRIILGLYEKYSGQVRYNGFESPSVYRNQIGFMLDTDGFYGHQTLLENLKFYAELYGVSFKDQSKYIKELLVLLDLNNAKEDKVSSFSHGMKQKASFIRSIIHQPKFLILDEPLNGLDPDMQSVLRDQLLFLKEKKGTTIFFSSHNLYEVERLCDKIAIIKNGEIKLEENLSALKDTVEGQEYSLESIYFQYSNG